MKKPGASRLFRLLIVGLLVLGTYGCATNPVTGKSELKIVDISEQEEVALGAQAYTPAVQQQGGFYRDPDLEAYVQGVGMRLAKVSHRPNLQYRYRVLNSSVPNAFALPGGFIVINRGLLVRLSSEGEMAAVLGHETVHVTAKHSLAGYQRAMASNVLLQGISIVAGGGAGGMGVQALSGVTASLIENGFSREQERESDEIGMDYMVKAGYDPKGMVNLQEYFYKEMEGGKDPMWVAGLFRTHPFSKDRLDETRKRLAEKYPNTLNNPKYVMNEEVFLQRTAGVRKVQKAYDVADQGDQLFQQKKYDEALAKYQEAARMEPQQAPFYSSAGQVHLVRKNYPAAEGEFRKAIGIDGEFFEPRLLLGALYYNQKNYRAAIPELKKSMDLVPTKEGAMMLSKSYEAVGDKANAKKYADMVK